MENIKKFHNKDIWTLDRGSSWNREMVSAHNTKTVHMSVHSVCIPLTALGEYVPVHAMKAYVNSKSIAPLILNLSTRWRWVVKFTPWLLYLWGKNLYVHQIGDCVGTRHFGEHKDHFDNGPWKYIISIFRLWLSWYWICLVLRKLQTFHRNLLPASSVES